MIDPQDDKTNSLPLDGTGATAPPALSSVARSKIEPPNEAMLNKEFDLVRVRGPVYSWDREAAKEKMERTANAGRVARHREKLAAEGLRQTPVPISLLEQVKAAGGWAEWQEQTAASAAATATEKATTATTAAIEKAKIAEAGEAAAKAIAREAGAKAEAAEAAAKAAATTAPPPEVIEEVKVAGGWSEWLTKNAIATKPATPTPEPKIVIKQVEVPAKLGRRDTESLELGRQVQAFTGWKAAVLKWLL